MGWALLLSECNGERTLGTALDVRAVHPTTPAPAGPTDPLRWMYTSPRAKRASGVHISVKCP